MITYLIIKNYVELSMFVVIKLTDTSSTVVDGFVENVACVSLFDSAVVNLI